MHSLFNCTIDSRQQWCTFPTVSHCWTAARVECSKLRCQRMRRSPNRSAAPRRVTLISRRKGEGGRESDLHMRVGSLCARSAEIRAAKRLYMVAIWPQIEQPRAIERDSRCVLAPLHTRSVHRIGLPMNLSLHRGPRQEQNATYSHAIKK